MAPELAASYPNNVPQQCRYPPMPSAFSQQPNDGVVDHAGLLAAGPPIERQGRYNPNAGVAGGCGNLASPFGDAASSTRLTVKDFDISYKPNNQLKAFSESFADYAHWASKVLITSSATSSGGEISLPTAIKERERDVIIR